MAAGDTTVGSRPEGDALVVWRLDRLGRSLPHLIETISTLEARGVGFRSLTESIDTTRMTARIRAEKGNRVKSHNAKRFYD